MILTRESELLGGEFFSMLLCPTKSFTRNCLEWNFSIPVPLGPVEIPHGLILEY